MVAPPSALPARSLRKMLSPLIEDAARESRADRYRKRFSARAHLWMLVIHAMSGGRSLRQSHAKQVADPAVLGFIGMEEPISFSQFARSSASRPAECFELLLASLLRQARARRGPNGTVAGLALPAGELVEVLDSTFLPLGPAGSPWAVHKGHPAGVRVQTTFDLLRSVPSAMEMTTVETNDAKALSEWDLSALTGKTVIFDLGYYSHANLKRLMEGGAHFLTRLKAQARYRVSESRSLPEGGHKTPEGDELISEQTIALGSPNNRRGTLIEGVRLITSRNEKGEVHRFVTDRFDLAGPTLLSLYRKRWQIELFFRWLKKQLGTLHPFGHRREAVWLTIVVAAIVALLTALLLESSRPKGLSRVAWLGALSVTLPRISRYDGYG